MSDGLSQTQLEEHRRDDEPDYDIGICQTCGHYGRVYTPCVACKERGSEGEYL